MPEDVGAWFATRIPAGWFVGPPQVTGDGDETSRLPEPDLRQLFALLHAAAAELAAGRWPIASATTSSSG